MSLGVLVLALGMSVLWGQTAPSAPKDAVELFERARDAIDAQNWIAAEARLRAYVRTYPRGDRADAALYYLAYALKKQLRLREADETLQHLVAAHPDSPWKTDAEAMQVEIAGHLRKTEVTSGALRSDDDRIRAAALRNLFRDDPEKGKAECARLLASGNPRVSVFCLDMLLQLHDRDSLSRVITAARSDAVPEVRIAAMTLLAGVPGEDTVGTVKDILLHDRTRVAEAALYALYRQHDWLNGTFLSEVLGRAEGDWVRGAAMLLLGAERSDAGLRRILHAYAGARSGLIRKFAIDAIWRNGSGQARAELERIAASAGDPGLQAEARYYLAGPSGPTAAEALARWYDVEQVEDVKMNILVLLSLAQTDMAVQKLRNVSTLESSVRLRRQAEALLEHGDIKIPLPFGQKQLPVRPFPVR